MSSASSPWCASLRARSSSAPTSVMRPRRACCDSSSFAHRDRSRFATVSCSSRISRFCSIMPAATWSSGAAADAPVRAVDDGCPPSPRGGTVYAGAHGRERPPRARHDDGVADERVRAPRPRRSKTSLIDEPPGASVEGPVGEPFLPATKRGPRAITVARPRFCAPGCAAARRPARVVDDDALQALPHEPREGVRELAGASTRSATSPRSDVSPDLRSALVPAPTPSSRECSSSSARSRLRFCESSFLCSTDASCLRRRARASPSSRRRAAPDARRRSAFLRRARRRPRERLPSAARRPRPRTRGARQLVLEVHAALATSRRGAARAPQRRLRGRDPPLARRLLLADAVHLVARGPLPGAQLLEPLVLFHRELALAHLVVGADPSWRPPARPPRVERGPLGASDLLGELGDGGLLDLVSTMSSSSLCAASWSVRSSSSRR
jgi:hypothetical protein